MSLETDFAEIDRAMETAVAEQVFPGGVLLWSGREKAFYHKGFGVTDYATKSLVRPDTVYDLASLTKPLATALAVADLIKRGVTDQTVPLSRMIPEVRGTDKASITLDMLLRHTAGLPAHLKFFERMPAEGGRAVLRQMLVAEPLAARPGETECYSDLGYMFLSWAVEVLSGCRLDAYVEKRIFRPFGLDTIGFLPRGLPIPGWCKDVAPTTDCPWRGRVMRGEVEDENAWAAGGIEGHAGLFGTAESVLTICRDVMAAVSGRGSRVLDPSVLQAFVTRSPGRGRVAGFDVPSGQASSAGRYYSRSAIGHLGFTGTSFWMDPESGLTTILLTNRVHPSRANVKIRAFRPLIHDLVSKAFIRCV